jgi:hypothetical protein
MQTHDAYAAACEACYGAPDEAMTEWRKHNPSPDESAGADEYKDAIYALRDTVPATLAGLAAKARAWRYLEKDIKEQADELVYSLATDISIMAGEVDREAVQS